MSFFEAEAWPSSTGDARAWPGPPRGVVPGIAHVDDEPLILGVSDQVAVLLGPLFVWRNCVRIPLTLFSRDEFIPDPIGDHARRRWGQDPWPPDDALHFGVQFDDGRRALRIGNLGWPPLSANPEYGLIPGGGGSGLGTFHWDYWLFPLPSGETMTLACAWPAYGIGETHIELDAAPLWAASRQTKTLWS